jgi:membrane-bound ClpP family serine protease
MAETDKRRLMRQSGRLLIAVGIVLFSVGLAGLGFTDGTGLLMIYLGLGFLIVASYLWVFSLNVGEDVTVIFEPSTGPITK